MAVVYRSDIAVEQITEDGAHEARFYAGFSLRNASGGALVVPIYDGEDATGALLDSIALAAGASLIYMYPIPLALASGSIFVDWTTGIVGNVRIIV